MPAGLFNHSVAGIDKGDYQAGVGGAGNHVPGILDMTRCIGDDEFPPGSREIFIRDIDGDPLFALGAEPVGEQGQIDLSVFLVTALLFEGGQLVGKDALAVIEEPSDEGALPVVHASCCYESE